MNNFNFDQSNIRKMVGDLSGLNHFLTKTYGWMAFAVLLSGLVAYLAGDVYRNAYLSFMSVHPWTMFFLVIMWFVLAMITQIQALRNPAVGIVLLIIFAALTGLTFSSIFLVYAKATIAAAFVASASDFIAMAFMGLTTKKDLTSMGHQALAALFGIIVAMIINMFLRMTIASLIISIIAVVVFSILTAFDSQRIKQMYIQFGNEVSSTGLAINGALDLYMDFINLFIEILSIFGLSNNNR